MKKKTKKNRVDLIIDARAKMLIKKFTEEGKASGSHITTCTKEQCLFPVCYCS